MKEQQQLQGINAILVIDPSERRIKFSVLKDRDRDKMKFTKAKEIVVGVSYRQWIDDWSVHITF